MAFSYPNLKAYLCVQERREPNEEIVASFTVNADTSDW